MVVVREWLCVARCWCFLLNDCVCSMLFAIYFVVGFSLLVSLVVCSLVIVCVFVARCALFLVFGGRQVLLVDGYWFVLFMIVAGCFRASFLNYCVLLVVDWLLSLLFVVCCSLFVVRCLLCVVDCSLLFVPYCLWFVVCGLLFVVCLLWFVVCGLLFVVCCLWFVVGDVLFVVCCLSLRVARFAYLLYGRWCLLVV